MKVFSNERSTLAESAVVSLSTLAAVGLLGLVLAYWTWVWLAPRPAPLAQVPAEASGRAGGASGLFGSVPRARNTALQSGIAIQLLGVVAASRHSDGYAVVKLEPRQILAVRNGENIVPGIRLAEVHSDHVIVERNGIRETLAWPAKTAAAEAAAAQINK